MKRNISYHRNGIHGLPFHVAIIKDKQNGPMLVVRFDKDADTETGQVICAAFNLEQLCHGNIEFGSNSFRGDEFAPIIDKLIAREAA